MELTQGMRVSLDPAHPGLTPLEATILTDGETIRAKGDDRADWLVDNLVVTVRHIDTNGLHEWTARIWITDQEVPVVTIVEPRGYVNIQRRRAPRVATEAAVEIAPYPRPDTTYWRPEVLTGIDLSEHGFAAALPHPPEEWQQLGATTAVTILLPDGAAVALAEITRIWVEDGEQRIAARFTHMVDESRRRFADFVVRTRAEHGVLLEWA